LPGRSLIWETFEREANVLVQYCTKSLVLSDGFLLMSQGQGCYQLMATTRTALDLHRNILHATARIVSGHAFVLGMISDYAY
jgi:hypothetical protein